MTTDPANLLNNLFQLSQIDAQLALILSERKKRESEITEKSTKLKTLRQRLEQESKTTADTLKRYKLDEMNLKHEQEKLIGRRKALSTLGGAKAQQAAQREIEAASRQLEVREEELLKEMIDLEEHEKKFTAIDNQISQLATELGLLEQDSTSFFANNEARRNEKLKEREVVVSTIAIGALKRYEAIAKRHTMDAVVTVVDKHCSACSSQIGPQIQLKISKASELVECPGCGRILWLGQQP